MERFSILYIEDNPFDVELVKLTLNKEGLLYEMINVDNKSEFIANLKKKHFDIILADYSLPSFDGIEALNILKTINPLIPFVFVSGEMGEEVAIESLKKGATDYVLKTHLNKLGASIVRVLKESAEIKKRKHAESMVIESYERLRKVFDEIVVAFSSLTEKKDPYTAGHQRNVAKISCAIAEELKLPNDTIECLKITAILHDIGKIYVPAEILNKPGKLTNLEFNIIKTHSEVGYDILKNIEFPWPVAKIVLQHHERIDGLGYPNGLKGDEILLESHIISVADVFEAMSSYRPYRGIAYGTDKALEYLITEKDKLFNKDVVNGLKQYYKKNKDEMKKLFQV